MSQMMRYILQMKKTKPHKLVADLDRVLSHTITHCDLSQYLCARRIDSRTFRLGRYHIVTSAAKTHSVCEANTGKPVHEDLYCVDAALALAENLNSGRTHCVPHILKAEKRYMNHYNELLFYQHNMHRNPTVYHHRSEVSLSRLQQALSEIRRYRLVPSTA